MQQIEMLSPNFMASKGPVDNILPHAVDLGHQRLCNEYIPILHTCLCSYLPQHL